MKRYLFALIPLCLMCALAAGCSDDNAATPAAPAAEDGQEAGDPQGEQSDPQAAQDGPQGPAGDYIDLTKMSSTMVYAEVSNIMANPDDYIGKTVRMSGLYYVEAGAEPGKNYHYVVIEDAAACCRQGLEFIWNGDHAYPKDYPKEQARIEIVGVFGSYDELGQTYYYVAVDDIVSE
ncbi:MAG: hypothetical protein FWG23_01310 [Eggerthellaceae bacterium]|nr:hypothetical protein [Eggerthellaceae bacterium]